MFSDPTGLDFADKGQLGTVGLIGSYPTTQVQGQIGWERSETPIYFAFGVFVPKITIGVRKSLEMVTIQGAGCEIVTWLRVLNSITGANYSPYDFSILPGGAGKLNKYLQADGGLDISSMIREETKNAKIPYEVGWINSEKKDLMPFVLQVLQEVSGLTYASGVINTSSGTHDANIVGADGSGRLEKLNTSDSDRGRYYAFPGQSDAAGEIGLLRMGIAVPTSLGVDEVLRLADLKKWQPEYRKSYAASTNNHEDYYQASSGYSGTQPDHTGHSQYF